MDQFVLDPLLVFLLVGAFSMSAAIAASKLLKLPVEEQPAWSRSDNGKRGVLLAGNLCVLVLVAAMAYGIVHLTWWVPVICLFVTFPVIHVLILERLLGHARGLLVAGLGSLAGAVLIGISW